MSRGRIYKIKSLAGFGNSKVARAAAFLEEAAERLIDVLAAADHRQLHFRPERSYLSMAGLSKHLTWGEIGWIGRLTGRPVPDVIRKTVGDSGPQELPDLPEDDATAEELIATIHTMRAEYTFPVLSRITDYQALVTYDNGPSAGPETVEQILTHLTWHWTYHTGQVGLLLLQAGYDYQWSFADNG